MEQQYCRGTYSSVAKSRSKYLSALLVALDDSMMMQKLSQYFGLRDQHKPELAGSLFSCASAPSTDGRGCGGFRERVVTVRPGLTETTPCVGACPDTETKRNSPTQNVKSMASDTLNHGIFKIPPFLFVYA